MKGKLNKPDAWDKLTDAALDILARDDLCAGISPTVLRRIVNVVSRLVFAFFLEHEKTRHEEDIVIIDLDKERLLSKLDIPPSQIKAGFGRFEV